MRPSDTGILLLSNCALIVGVLGEALPPDSIPIQCATICGPMVELTSICSGRSGKIKSKSSSNKRRNMNKEKRRAITQQKNAASQHREQQGEGPLQGRDFTVIVPAPTSFPSSLLVQQGTVEPPRESKITRIRPTQILPTQEPPPPPPPPKASSTPPPKPAPAPAPTQKEPPASEPTQSGQGTTNKLTTESIRGTATSTTQSPHSSMDTMNDGDGASDGDDEDANNNNGTKPDKDQGRWTMNNGEKDCVCDNKSFNVPNVAALCSSCIATAKQLQNDMDVIMTTCKFASEQYSPDKDKVVNNVQVQATPPKAVWGQNAGVANGGAVTLSPIRSTHVAVGAALSFIQLWLL
ncbi:hypothetical protein NLG97_g1812 [Lecanicillium saksenae]|uniref:Uncharacterized protein n=1 Tax=Lecanicillium saksenae TaxID=468837 RepID=A0ACC1R5C9_9HYPO|nr:hypothetical protein NLG97_g1812 [Lecanicillium saksenae]